MFSFYLPWVFILVDTQTQASAETECDNDVRIVKCGLGKVDTNDLCTQECSIGNNRSRNTSLEIGHPLCIRNCIRNLCVDECRKQCKLNRENICTYAGPDESA
jgi:hypothetical protein